MLITFFKWPNEIFRRWTIRSCLFFGLYIIINISPYGGYSTPVENIRQEGNVYFLICLMNQIIAKTRRAAMRMLKITILAYMSHAQLPPVQFPPIIQP